MTVDYGLARSGSGHASSSNFSNVSQSGSSSTATVTQN